MRSVIVIVAALACAEAIGLAEVLSNYAKVTTNNRPETTEQAAASVIANDTDYDDFDDLEEATRQSNASSMLKYFNGVVNLLALMYKFSGIGRRPALSHARFHPDAVSNKFKMDQSNQPISNFPPYNPLTANDADSYSINNMKTSYDTDHEQYQPGTNLMSDYMAQNAESNADIQESYSYQEPYDSYGGKHELETWKPTDAWSSHNHLPVEYHDVIEDEDRDSKRPYSYYFLGRKLWYIPLIFSVYLIIYIGALVLKSVARHKIQFPDKLWDLKDQHDYIKHRRGRKIDELTDRYESAIQTATNKFM